MNPIMELKERLKKHPDILVTEFEGGIVILPKDENGFEIALTNEGIQYTVTFDGGWHEHFEEPEEALECVGFGLSDRCRLKVEMRGNSPQKWIVEYFQDGVWHEDSTTGLFFFPFWRRKTVIYRKNNLIAKR